MKKKESNQRSNQNYSMNTMTGNEKQAHAHTFDDTYVRSVCVCVYI